MSPKDIIRQLMVGKNISQARLGELIGKKQTHINGILNRNTSMRYAVFEQLIEAMGYSVEINGRKVANIASHLQALFSASGLTKTELGKKCGITQNNMSRMLKEGNVKVDTLVKILDALGAEMSVENYKVS